MCGIAGVIYNDPGRPAERDLLERMTRTLIHRGPDEEGYHLEGNFGLGARRLSIIDTQTGSQPLCNEDGTIWVAQNGEIYNYQDLRKDLLARGHVLRSQGDTEVIAHLYEEGPERFVQRLNGMFAFALWDRRRQQLLLVRDRLGVKPLYYAQLPDRLLFGSEIKSLLADPSLPRDLDPQALHHYLSLGYVPGPWSIFAAIRKLGPGELLRWEGGSFSIQPYWRYPRPIAAGTGDGDRGALQARLRDLLADAVRIRLFSDVPLGMFLSGGVDSSAVLAFMARQVDRPVKAFSIGFTEKSYDELPFARLAARSFGAEHTEQVMSPDLLDGVGRLAQFLDEPFADSSAIPTFYLSQMTRRSVTVALSGDGGDETFAGYYTYLANRLLVPYRALPLPLRRMAPRVMDWLPTSDRKLSLDLKLRRFLYGGQFPPARAHYAWKEWLTEGEKRALYAPRWAEQELEPTHLLFEGRHEAAGPTDPINASIYVDSTIYLPDDILVKADRMSMAHSLELRSPFLDYRIIEAMADVPGWLKVRGLRLKALLKDTLRGILPDELLDRKKAGFNVPVGSWLRGPLRPLLMEALDRDRLASRGALDPEGVHRLIDAHLEQHGDYGRPLWNLLMYSLWEANFGSTR